MRLLRRDEGGGRAADRACRHRRRLAGRCRSPRALTELRRRCGRARGALPAARRGARSGKLKPRDPAQPEDGSGYVVLAMGKMGAFELNYSSDIDLIVLFDADGADARARTSSRPPFFVRLTRGS